MFSAAHRAALLFSNITHGLSGTPEHAAWKRMKHRCYNPSNPKFHRYGGRGITVCDRWRNDFAAFLADVGPRPAGASLDRINNDGNYEPGNVRWATPRQQSNNTRRNRRFTFRGESKTISEWARIVGIREKALRLRLCRYGWPVERAMTEPLAPGRRKVIR